ncbi:arginyl-tRNA--protein transferase 2 [Typha latifolia]|uniref:arginyl-tRNA--protein transferase 2 n=1 Tax=Typha latifolia TaxID=4733 RepID=UPI003C304519
MGDGASSSRSGKGKGRGETLVIDHGRRRTSCGYCRSNTDSSISHGLWANSLTADDYQELLDRGWRRSGCFLYKPDMKRTCCPSYTIRLKTDDFIPSKEQSRIYNRMQRFLDGTFDINKKFKEEMNCSKGSSSQVINASFPEVSALSGKITTLDARQKLFREDEFICYISDRIDSAIKACFKDGEFPSIPQLPKALVKRVTSQMQKKLSQTEDLLYTSSICFQIAATIRNSCPTESSTVNFSSHENQSGESSDTSPKGIAEKLVQSMEQSGEFPGFLVKACNGHLNFYSVGLTSTKIPTKASKDDADCSKRSCSSNSSLCLPHKRRKLEIRMKRSSFDPEEFALYRKYQIKVHDDKKVTESSYKRFLVDTPIVFVPSRGDDEAIPPCGLGSFHQQYVVDGKLVAVGVVDILPRCLSSKYLFWDPDFAFLSLGKYSALQEINWVKEMQGHCPNLQYYYLGYYIHSCSKMRYKAAYRPSELLCPLRYTWVPYDIARPLLDKRSYVILSDLKFMQDQALLPQVPDSSMNCARDEYCSFENGNKDFEYGHSDTVMGDRPGLEGRNASVTKELMDDDISNIMIDLNGKHVEVKELQQVFGPIEKRFIAELERQLRRYVKVVGKELSIRMIYSLG